MSKIQTSNLAGNTSIRGREENDYYATPPKTTKAILDVLKLTGSIYEPACGEGHIVKVLKEYYPDNKIYSSDLIDRGYNKGGINFLTHDYKDKKFCNIITNPPFKFAEEFIRKSLDITTDKVLILCKIQLLESKQRSKMFNETPLKYIYVFTNRQATWMNGQEVDEKGKPWSTTMCLAWYIWEHGYKGEPIMRWLQ